MTNYGDIKQAKATATKQDTAGLGTRDLNAMFANNNEIKKEMFPGGSPVSQP